MLSVAVFVCVGWIVSVCIHEFGHAVVAYWGGDTSVKDKGYLTLNPIKYTDPQMSLILPTIFLLMGGMALPGAAVYIDRRRLRNRWWQSAVSAAGPMASILVTLLLAIPFWMGLTSLDSQQWIWPALAFLISLEIYVVLLNLLPIPPLDGYGIIEPWLPAQIQNQLRRFGNYGMTTLFILLWFLPPFNLSLWGLSFRIGETLGIPMTMIVTGSQLFKTSSGILLLIGIGVILLGRRLMSPHESLYHKGNKLLKSQQYEQAIASYDKAIRVKPDFYDAWFHRGVALSRLRRYEQAIASYDRTIQIQPDYAYAWYNKAGCYAKQGNVNLAIDHLQQAIKLDPDTLIKYAKTDSSFDSIRENERFQKLISEIKSV